MRHLFLLMLVISVQANAADNLLVNGTFDVDFSSWTVANAPGRISWSAVDEFDDDNSGSIRMEEGGEFGPTVSQCVNLDNPALKPALVASYLVPDTVTTSHGSIWISLTGYAASDCQPGTVFNESRNKNQDSSLGWQKITSVGEPGAASLKAQLFVVGPSGTTDLIVHFDNVFLGDIQFADGFESPGSN